MYTILGAGLSGLSVADHLKKKGIPFNLYEAKPHGGGHIYSEQMDGFTWDEGPHVSFTKYDYVKEYFAENCKQSFLEYPANPTNYFQGSWIMHPAQSHLYAIDEPLRSAVISDLLVARNCTPENYQPENYKEWTDYAFGKTFSETFPSVYTKKYWTTESENLATDWIGKRIYFPQVADMANSANGPLNKQTHYINKVRYPSQGGFYSYIKTVEKQLPVNYNKRLSNISFSKKQLSFSDGDTMGYDKLINTLPLPFLLLNSDAPDDIKLEARKLKCSQLLIINVVVDHPPVIDNHWIYIYDKDFYSTRINFTDLLASENGIEGKCGIQVEVYFSEYHPLNASLEEIEQQVLNELVSMTLIKSSDNIESFHHKWIEWANVIFDKERECSQEIVLNWLATRGLVREADDLYPMTDWDEKTPITMGDIILAGRFAQWKYYWTDDCVMRGKYISDCISQSI